MESKKHKLLKEYAKTLLIEVYQVPKEDIYEEFTLSNIKFDVVAYPTIEKRKDPIIAIECGKKKHNIVDNYYHFKKALKYVDSVLWIPYKVDLAPYADMVNHRISNLLFIQYRYPLFDKKYSAILNSYVRDGICCMHILKRVNMPVNEEKLNELKLAWMDLEGEEYIKIIHDPLNKKLVPYLDYGNETK